MQNIKGTEYLAKFFFHKKGFKALQGLGETPNKIICLYAVAKLMLQKERPFPDVGNDLYNEYGMVQITAYNREPTA